MTVSRYVIVLMVWLGLAIVLNGLGLAPDTPAWWLLVAPPAIAFGLTIAGGVVLSLAALAVALLAPSRQSGPTTPRTRV